MESRVRIPAEVSISFVVVNPILTSLILPYPEEVILDVTSRNPPTLKLCWISVLSNIRTELAELLILKAPEMVSIWFGSETPILTSPIPASVEISPKVLVIPETFNLPSTDTTSLEDVNLSSGENW